MATNPDPAGGAAPPRDFGAVLVTGGAGFVGSNFTRWLLGRGDFRGRVVVLDSLTYAGSMENLAGLAEAYGPRFEFAPGDIRDAALVGRLFSGRGIDAVAHFAAESHVDRSIAAPGDFVSTNVLGTGLLLDAARATWGARTDVRFHHVSTDEVFGSIEAPGRFDEDSPYAPRSPYAASKAGADHLAMSYFHTYGLPVSVTNCSNNYGPRQHGEKLVPLMVRKLAEGRPLPVYGDGRNVRDWLHVDDHAAAVWAAMTRGAPGSRYCVGAGNEVENLELIRLLAEAVAGLTGRDAEKLMRLVRFVPDRPGHDRRYALDTVRIGRELRWKAEVPFRGGLAATAAWYLGKA